jgi:hypothetical protein
LGEKDCAAFVLPFRRLLREEPLSGAPPSQETVKAQPPSPVQLLLAFLLAVAAGVHYVVDFVVVLGCLPLNSWIMLSTTSFSAMGDFDGQATLLR